MAIYEVELLETWKDKESGEEREPLLADPVKVLAGSGEKAIAAAKASAMLKEEEGKVDDETFHEVMSKVSVENLNHICDVDLCNQ